MTSVRNLPFLLLGSLLIGLGCSLFFRMVFSFGQIPPQARLFDFFIPLVVLCFFTILIRARKVDRTFHFWEGLVVCNFMLWTGGLFSGILIYVFASLDGGFFDNFLSSSVRYLVETDRYAAASLKVKDLPVQIGKLKALKPGDLILDELVKKVYYSFLLSPFVAMIFRRK